MLTERFINSFGYCSFMNRISTGIGVLDVLLDGGYEIDSVTTIYGPAGSGKTNIALIAAVNAAKSGKKVIYIDTEGGFSISRLEQLAPNYKKTKLLEKIVFLQPTNFEEQKKSFEKLKSIINSNVGLIIVDTLTMLYRLEKHMTNEIQDINGELALQIGLLSEIARKKLIPVLITNQVYTGFDNGALQIVGGDIIKYSSKCLIELQSFHAQKRKAVLRKHRSIAGEKEALFEIDKYAKNVDRDNDLSSKFIQDFVKMVNSIPENSKQKELIKYMGKSGAYEIVDVLITKWNL